MPAFTVIDHTEIGAGGATSWSATSIPSSYDHLCLKISARSDNVSYYAPCALQFGNGSVDTGTNYSATWLYTVTSTPASWRHSGSTSFEYMYANGASSLADTFSSFNLWIPNYANTANFKQGVVQLAIENASTTDSQWDLINAGLLWSSTSAIDTISYANYSVSDDFVQYSTFTLYGVTGA